MSIEKLRAQLSILILVVLQVLQASDKKYVVETSTQVVERCMLMTTDPGDLVLDPTYGKRRGTLKPSQTPFLPS
jgi:hypothetical protein